MSGAFKRNLYPQLLTVNADTYLPVVDMVGEATAGYV